MSDNVTPELLAAVKKAQEELAKPKDTAATPENKTFSTADIATMCADAFIAGFNEGKKILSQAGDGIQRDNVIKEFDREVRKAMGFPPAEEVPVA